MNMFLQGSAFSSIRSQLHSIAFAADTIRVIVKKLPL